MSRRQKRTDIEVFSLSFLDCICCGFGAMILLFVLTISKADQVSRISRASLQQELQQRIAEHATLQLIHDKLKGETSDAQIEDVKLKHDAGDLDREIATLKDELQNEEGGRKALLVEVDDMKRQVAAMQKEIVDIPQIDTKTPIGIPVESNYVAFVIDTSGSMRDPNTEALWGFVLKKFIEVLHAYPVVKGVQFLDGDGRFIIGSAGEWISDSEDARDAMIAAIKRYRIFSESNPVPGIQRAIRTLYDPKNPDMKMGIYVFGDEFTETADKVIAQIDKSNPPDSTGKRPITINGIGFPTGAWAVGFSMGQTGMKFSNLLRELAWRNGGAFIAVTEGVAND